MASTRIQLSLSFLLLLLISQFSWATYANNHFTYLQLLTSQSSKQKKLIKSLNLFPKDSINIGPHDISFAAPMVVEKSFSFPSLGYPGPSVADLGHHAGYYSLPHSKAARMFYLFFESRSNKNDPVVIWLTGGPGCSSELCYTLLSQFSWATYDIH